ncbi:MAG: polyphenol oxidase family protein [Acidobacteria bacterium]|nr:polyphenol oxidase family protein [Acidobacteriota bacterium]
MAESLTSPLLTRRAGVRHGFSPDPAGVSAWRPQQVHGAAVAEPTGAAAPPVPADAALSRAGGPAIGVVTADCVPLLLAAEGGAAVAAVHAGWRGLAAGVIEAAIERLRTAAPGRALVAAIGPAAGGCCYEVGPGVIEAVAPAALRVVPGPRGRPLLDLRGVVEDRLRRAGLAPEAIERVGPCTVCGQGWPSYRRDGERAGRALAFVEPAGA